MKLENIFKSLTAKGFSFYDNDFGWDFFKRFSLSSILKFSINNNKVYREKDFIEDLEKSNLDEKWIQYIINSRRFHKWHLVSPSPWPFFSSLSALILVLGFVLWMYKVPSSLDSYSPSLVTSGFFLILFTMFLWFRDIIREGFLGYHTTSVLKNLRMGFILFIVSEVMFFFSFFWAYFHFSIDPSIWGGDVWPPDGIIYFWLCENIIFADAPSSGVLSPLFYEYSFFEMPYNIFYNPTFDFQNWTLFTKPQNCLLGFDRFHSALFHFSRLSKDCSDANYSDYLELVISQNLISTGTSLGIISNVDLDSILKSEFDYSAFNPYVDEKNSIADFNQSLDLYNSYFSAFKESYLKSYNNSISTMPAYNNIGELFSTINIHYNLYDRGLLINPFKIPLLNTCILLTSGAWLTISHIKLKRGEFLESLIFLSITLVFAILFIVLQFSEYVKSGFGINDTVYGGIFYMLTGFHGFHVIIGTIFLGICLVRMHLMHFSPGNHFGFEAAIWYWHFVDVVRVFLYIFVYLWPGFYFYVNHTSCDYETFSSASIPFIHCKDIVIGVNIDFLLSEFPNSTFNYHRAFSSEVKRKIISQISNTSLAFEKFNQIKEKLNINVGATSVSDNNIKYTPTQLFYNYSASSLSETFSNLSKLENTYNSTICWHNFFNFKKNYHNSLFNYNGSHFNSYYKYSFNLNTPRFYNFELLFKDKLSNVRLTGENLYNTGDFYINYNKYIIKN